MYDEIENIMKNSGEYTALPTIVTQPSLTSIIETYNTKVHRFKRTIDGSTPDNPLVVSMQEELNNDRSRILQTLSSARASLVAERDNIQPPAACPYRRAGFVAACGQGLSGDIP